MVIDFATSVVPLGKVEEFARKAATLLPGWAIGCHGRPTTDPEEVMRHGGSLLTLGGDYQHGGHKGYCLSAMVDVLCAVLSGGNWGPTVDGFIVPSGKDGATGPGVPGATNKATPVGIGHFFGCLRIDGFREPQAFKQTMDQWIAAFRASEPIDPAQPVRVPGDPEWEAMDIREREGVPVKFTVLADLLDVAHAVGVQPPFDEAAVDLRDVRRVVATL